MALDPRLNSVNLDLTKMPPIRVTGQQGALGALDFLAGFHHAHTANPQVPYSYKRPPIRTNNTNPPYLRGVERERASCKAVTTTNQPPKENTR